VKVKFLKMHGAGNDFVVIDHRAPFLSGPVETLFARLCDRRRGIGADGVLLLERDPEFDYAMRYYNADGRPAEYCGNGARCLALLALDLGLGRGGEVHFRTAAGVQRARRDPSGRGIRLAFGQPVRGGEEVRVEAAGRAFSGRLLEPGVPHFVTAVERVEWVPVAEWGTALRHHPRFGAPGANVDFVAPLGPGRLAMRTYERGVEAETLACGSGAIASALWWAVGGQPSPVRVLTAGGDELVVEFRANRDGYDDVYLTGPAEVSFTGEWPAPIPAGAGAA
jgi:diaminopimelate epimerase